MSEYAIFPYCKITLLLFGIEVSRIALRESISIL